MNKKELEFLKQYLENIKKMFEYSEGSFLLPDMNKPNRTKATTMFNSLEIFMESVFNSNNLKDYDSMLGIITETAFLYQKGIEPDLLMQTFKNNIKKV